MLQHQQTSEEQATSAAQIRVSPQELVEAISAIEARKDAEHSQQADTVALGEAVEQLGLHTTPEELLAEIEHRRTSNTVASTAVRKRPRRLTPMGVLLFFSLAVNLTFLWNGLAAQPPRTVQTPSLATTPTPRTPELRQLASVPENRVVHTDYTAIQDLAHGKDAAQVSVDVRSEKLDQYGLSDLDNLWSLIKKGGHLYVRAWTSPEIVLRIANGHAGHVVNHTYDKTGVTVDVPIERFHNATTDTFYAPDGSPANPQPVGNTGDDFHIPIGVELEEAPAKVGAPNNVK